MNQIEKYFNAEKAESLLFIIVGLLAMIIAIYFIVIIKTPFYKGFAYALIAIALLQLIVGTTVYFRSPKDIIKVNNIIEYNDHLKIKSEEIPRMQTVMKNFIIYRWIEIVLIIAGVISIFVFPTLQFWKGLGAGFALQGILMLLLDLFAENRGKVYLNYLQSFVN